MGKADSGRVLYPVVLPVPPAGRRLKGREKVACLSRCARQALILSANKSGILLGELAKDESGAPLPFDGCYWSLTHKTDFVGAVIASGPVGIDIERIRPVAASLFKKVADDLEWELSAGDPLQRFFRYWTAKEAVLKAAAVGLRGLSRCRIKQVVDDRRLVIEYMQKHWSVEQLFFEQHLAAVVRAADRVEWIKASIDQPT